jgi:predicted ATP-dependent endonuclease of OLD family
MKLAKINISDFRSILSQEINFQENCIGLIGLNESGKSNVLNAIRILDNTYPL